MCVFRNIIVVIFLCAVVCMSAASSASSERLNMKAETEYGLSDFYRSPEPPEGSTGTHLSQDYRLYLEGGIFKQGMLDAMVGAELQDKYGTRDFNTENKVRFDYGKWLRIETLSKQEIDEDMFFAGSIQPQSPIRTVTNKYSGKLKIDKVTTVDYVLEDRERRDLLLGTVTGEETETKTLKFKRRARGLTISGKYRQRDFKDLLGTRSDIASKDIGMEIFYRPKNYISILAGFDDETDEDVDKGTELHSRNSRMELALKPVQGLKIRDRVTLRQDDDSKTGENIINVSNEIIINFDPRKETTFELAYKRSEEDKERNVDIISTTDETRFKMRLIPINGVTVQSGVEITDKVSSSSAENLLNTKVYTDLTLEPVKTTKIGANISNTSQKNTFTSQVISNTTAMSATLQYRPRGRFYWFLQGNTSITDNPSTDSFTRTDTVSSSLNMDPFSFLDISFRTSGQRTTGSSGSGDSNRLLNSIELSMKLLNNMNFSAEYEMINSTGASSTNESLVDLSLFYHLTKMDFSLRYQIRDISGSATTGKTLILSDLKYRISKNIVFSVRFSMTDYSDQVDSFNSYDTTLIESLLSMKF